MSHTQHSTTPRILQNKNHQDSKTNQEVSDRVVLNVGGCRFETRRSTLCQRPSMFSVMFGGSFAQPSPDFNGEFFFDRDPTHFRALLNYLRTGKIFLPSTSLNANAQFELLLEAEYFGVDALANEIKRVNQLPMYFSLSASSGFEAGSKKLIPRLLQGIVTENLLVSLEASNIEFFALDGEHWVDASGRERHATMHHCVVTQDLANTSDPSSPADRLKAAGAGSVEQLRIVAATDDTLDPPNTTNEVSGGEQVPHSLQRPAIRCVQFQSFSHSRITIPCDINPSKHCSLTLEIWIKLQSFEQPSLIFGHEKPPTHRGSANRFRAARGIYLSDPRFGSTTRIGHIAVGGGAPYDSKAGLLPRYQWTHLVGVWDQRPKQRPSASLYINGKHYPAQGEIAPVMGLTYLFIGKAPHQNHNQPETQLDYSPRSTINGHHYAHRTAYRATNNATLPNVHHNNANLVSAQTRSTPTCQIASIRAYSAALNEQEVHQNYDAFVNYYFGAGQNSTVVASTSLASSSSAINVDPTTIGQQNPPQNVE